MDLFNQLYQAEVIVVLIAALSIGVLTSLHCVGMCGGITLAFCQTTTQNMTYQVARLLGYLILSFLFQSFSFVIQDLAKDWLIFIGTLLLSSVFLYASLSYWRGREPQIFPSLFSLLYKRATRISTKSGILRSFFIGLSSVILPCASLYAVVIALSSSQSNELSLLAITAFWLGTLPLMFSSVKLAQKIKKYLGPKSFKLISITFLALGIMSLAYRLYQLKTGDLCLT